MPLRSPSAFAEQLAQHDADVFDGVVLVHVEIAFGVQLQVEAAMLGEQLQHVVEEADAGGDSYLPWPSMRRLPEICVSLVLRWMVALLMRENLSI